MIIGGLYRAKLKGLKYNKDTKIKDIFFKYKYLLIFVLVFFTLFLSIGYAQVINELSVVGTVEANVQNGVFISNIVYDSSRSNHVSSENGNINTFIQNTYSSSISLPNLDSRYTYKISIYNNTQDTLAYNGTTPSKQNVQNSNIEIADTYTNTDIWFVVTDASGNEVNSSTKLSPNSSIDLYVTFYYKDGATSVGELNSLMSINFRNDSYIKVTLDVQRCYNRRDWSYLL